MLVSAFPPRRNLALRARGLFSNSSSVGKIGFLVMTFTCGCFPQMHTGVPGGQVQGLASLAKVCFTILSSSE